MRSKDHFIRTLTSQKEQLITQLEEFMQLNKHEQQLSHNRLNSDLISLQEQNRELAREKEEIVGKLHREI